MLVLSRRIGERIVVPHCELLSTLFGIDGNTIRLGMTVPAEIGVYREEPWRRAGSRAATHDQPSPPVTVLDLLRPFFQLISRPEASKVFPLVRPLSARNTDSTPAGVRR